MKYEIGQEVWVAHFTSMAPTYVGCPDCGGTGRLRVTFHDDTQVSIECRNCSVGYDPPSGRIKIYQNEPSARHTVITGVEINGAETTWKTTNGYIHDENDVFDSEEEAFVAAKKKQSVYELEQKEKVAHKEKDTRSWAWNASYHRKCIKEAQRNLEYHTAKLAVASLKVKKERVE